ITRTVASTTFNGLAILAGDAGAQSYQVGAGSDATINAITVTTTDLSGDAAVTDVTSGNIGTDTAALAAMDDIDTLIDTVTTERATYGAVQNRFESVISNLQSAVESQTAARSRIMDADFAAETAAMTRAQVLQQAGVAMLSQANAMPNTVLSLLRR